MPETAAANPASERIGEMRCPMNRLLVILTVLLAAGVAGAWPAPLAGQQNQPGLPTLAKVHILNRERAEAVPVRVMGSADVLPISVVGEPTVNLSPAAVIGTRSARQLWEYRRLSVSAAQDATAALNGAGNEGWEAVGMVTVGENAIWTLKRPK
jgi:hypothetical protein